MTCREKYVIAPTTELAQNGPLSGAARFDKEAYEKGVREPKPALVTELSGQGLKVALLDLGAKRNIARSLAERGCEVTVYPAGTPAQEIIDDNPDGIMLSNGPGDPKTCTVVIENIKKLSEKQKISDNVGVGVQVVQYTNEGKMESEYYDKEYIFPIRKVKLTEADKLEVKQYWNSGEFSIEEIAKKCRLLEKKVRNIIGLKKK